MIGVIAAQNVQHGGQRHSTHNGSILAQGILNPQAIAQRRILRQPNLVENGGRNKGISDNFAVTQATAQDAGLIFRQHIGSITALSRGFESGGGNLIVAIGTAHFFRNIRHQIQVGTEGGYINGISLYRNFQPVQIQNHILFGNVGAQQIVDFLHFQRESLGGGNVVDNVNGSVQNIAACQKLHQFAGPLHGRNSHHGVKMLFELAGSIGTHAQSQGGLANGSAAEIGGFKHHHGGIFLDFGVFSAHNAGQTDGLVAVGNHQHAGLQITDIAVQSGEGLIGLRFPDYDFAGGNIPVVKSVHGLAIFQHHIVGDIHNVVNGADAVGSEALPQPLGGGGNLDIGHHPGGVAVAEGFRRHFHIQLFEDGAGIRAVHHRLMVLHGQAESGGGFSCQADDGVAVGTVIGDFKIHHSVVVADDGVDIVAGLAVFVIQNPDAVGIGVGQIILGQTQFRKGAEHTVGYFATEFALGDVYAAGKIGIVQGGRNQIALTDILSAGDDLHRGFLAHVNLAYPHVVRIFVPDNGHNFTNLDVFNFCI